MVDLGCGVGLDICLLTSTYLPDARCVGVDLTPAMCDKALANATLCGRGRVKVVQGVVDCALLPENLADAGLVIPATVDVVISNGVFNLCHDKRQAFANAFSLLKPGGSFLLVDMVRELGAANLSGAGGGTSWAD